MSKKLRNLRGGGQHSVKEVYCLVCNHRLKRRKYKKTGIGPTCARKIAGGYSGIQMKAFEPSSPFSPENIKRFEI